MPTIGDKGAIYFDKKKQKVSMDLICWIKNMKNKKLNSRYSIVENDHS
jgi:hypothetical protein